MFHDHHVGIWFPTSECAGTCVDGDTYAPLAEFRREPCSGLFTLHTASPQVVASCQVAASGQVAASYSCRSLTHPTVLWHHRLGHPSLPRLRNMASQCLVSGLLHVFASLPPSPATSCIPCVEGRLRTAPHSSSLRLATAPFQTLHLDVWGPAPRPGPERESFFLVVVDDYSRYATVFPLAKKSDVTSTLIRWLLATETIRGRRVSCLDSDRGVPQQNGLAERRIGLVMEIGRTSMILASAPHFLWPYAVRYAAHQLNLWPRVSRPKASPTSLGLGPLVLLQSFVSWADLRLSTTPLRTSFWLAPSPLSSLVSRWAPLTSRFTTRPSTGSLTPMMSPLTSPSPTTPGTSVQVSRFPPHSPFSLPHSSSCSRSSGVSHATPPPSVARQVPPPSQPPSSSSPQQPSTLPRQVAVDSGVVGVGGTSAGGAGAEGAGTGFASSGGIGAEGAGTGGAIHGGAGAGGAGYEEVGVGGTATAAPTPPPHRYPTRH
ncbi:unnamed protein product [Closterium sp. NIES-54]